MWRDVSVAAELKELATLELQAFGDTSMRAASTVVLLAQVYLQLRASDSEVQTELSDVVTLLRLAVASYSGVYGAGHRKTTEAAALLKDFTSALQGQA